MAVHHVQHFTVATKDLAVCKRFYIGALGLTDGWRPPFRFPGAWLYAEGQPIVHLIGADDGVGRGGVLDHVALQCSDVAGVTCRLRDLGIGFEIRTQVASGLHQVFVWDPDGAKIELNFPASEDVSRAAASPKAVGAMAPAAKPKAKASKVPA
ncbi:MAG: glyoxalase [Alphaproteobacteria bacterium]|nr:glyoxalase [Alphaproteobacteria bacterium]